MEPVTVREWLERREPPAPPRLLERMRAALATSAAAPPSLAAPATTDAAPPSPISAALGEAALVCLRAAIVKGDTRAAALDLLAADALLTYGCEAAAQADPGALHAFARAFSAARLAELMPDPS